VSQVTVGGQGNEEAWLRRASVQAIGSHTDRSDATPPLCLRPGQQG
jgi:hypothetical protein